MRLRRKRLGIKRGRGLNLPIELDDSLAGISRTPGRRAGGRPTPVTAPRCSTRDKPRIVELRFFVGLTEKEIAETLDISERTVKRDWQMARAWILKELGPLLLWSDGRA